MHLFDDPGCVEHQAIHPAFERGSAEILAGRVRRLQARAHGAVENEHALRECVKERGREFRCHLAAMLPSGSKNQFTRMEILWHDAHLVRAAPGGAVPAGEPLRRLENVLSRTSRKRRSRWTQPLSNPFPTRCSRFGCRPARKCSHIPRERCASSTSGYSSATAYASS